ncbi:MAG: transglutaminase family protein, partial [Usitatibacter sp.]
MTIKVALHHRTHYSFDRPVGLSPHEVRLRPAAHCRTPIVAYSLVVTPTKHFVNWQQDPFGNHLAHFVFDEPTDELRVEVDLVADLVTINPFDFFLDEAVETFPFAYEAATARDLSPYLARTGGGTRFDQLLGRIRDDVVRSGRRTVDVLVDINQLVQRVLRYDIRMEPGVFAPEETLERGHGSCRDFAWLLVNVLRHLGVAARFVSGYSIQLVPDQKPLEGAVGVAQDCTDLHAWAEAYLPGAGWVGFDATSGMACGEGHIPLACTADPGAAAPVLGSFSWDKREEDDELGESFAFEMQVTRIEDRPRPTRSYSAAQWEAILACGDAVDRALEAGDVRLTMGGEPTFVSVDDMEGPEWSTAALGPNKARLADQLLRRLRARFAPGALLHHGQGKWYPGEPLPRWAYSCYWRKDGEPVWSEPALLADGSARRDGADQARAFLRALVGRLGIDEGHALPG